MNEGRFFKNPSGEDSRFFVRKGKHLEDEAFSLVLDHREKELAGGRSGLLKKLKENELEKTPEQEKIIDFTVEEVRGFIEKYGLGKETVSKDKYFF